MTTFVDTSALLALLDADDEFHRKALEAWHRLTEAEAPLVSTNYVVVETVAVAQHRLGLGAVRALVREILPVLDVTFATQVEHDAAMAALLTAGRRRLSLVDCVSFEVMRRQHLQEAFTFDPHFHEQGYVLVGR
jgi:uncharacterized protein